MLFLKIVGCVIIVLIGAYLHEKFINYRKKIY